MTRFDSGLRGFGQIRQQYEVQKDRWCIWHAMNDIDFSDYMVTSKPDHGGSQGHMPSNSNSLPIKSRQVSRWLNSVRSIPNGSGWSGRSGWSGLSSWYKLCDFFQMISKPIFAFSSGYTHCHLWFMRPWVEHGNKIERFKRATLWGYGPCILDVENNC